MNLSASDELETLLSGALPSFTLHRARDERLLFLASCVRTARFRLESPDMAPVALRHLARYVRLASSCVLPLNHHLFDPAPLDSGVRELGRAELLDGASVETAREVVASLNREPANALMPLLTRVLVEHEGDAPEPMLVIPNQLRSAMDEVTSFLEGILPRAVHTMVRSRLPSIEVGSLVLLCGDVMIQYRDQAHLLTPPGRFHVLLHSWQSDAVPVQPHIERSPRRVQVVIARQWKVNAASDSRPEPAAATGADWAPVLEDHVLADDDVFQLDATELPVPGEQPVRAVRVLLGGRRMVYFDCDGARRVVIPRWLSSTRKNEVKLLPVTELEVGMLWAQGGSTEEVLELLRDDPKYRSWKKATQGWKKMLQVRLDRDQDGLVQELVRAGCDGAVVRANLRSWAGENRILPRQRQTFAAILRALGRERDLDVLWKAGRELQIAHQSTGLHQHRYQLESMSAADEHRLRIDGFAVLGAEPGVRDGGLAVYEIEDIQEVAHPLSERVIDRISLRGR